MEVLVPREADTKVLVYEVYRDDAAFDVHRSGPSLAQWREETAGMIAKFSVTRTHPSSQERQLRVLEGRRKST